MNISKLLQKLLLHKKLDLTDYCSECGEKIPRILPDSEHEIFIRKYRGGKGHLVSLGFHRQCLIQRMSIDAIFDTI